MSTFFRLTRNSFVLALLSFFWTKTISSFPLQAILLRQCRIEYPLEDSSQKSILSGRRILTPMRLQFSMHILRGVSFLRFSDKGSRPLVIKNVMSFSVMNSNSSLSLLSSRVVQAFLFLIYSSQLIEHTICRQLLPVTLSSNLSLTNLDHAYSTQLKNSIDPCIFDSSSQTISS